MSTLSPATTKSTTKMVFSIDIELAKKIKAEIPARKRSEFIEDLIREYLYEDNKEKAWEIMQKMRRIYDRDKDPIKLSAVERIRQDRQSH